MIRYSTDQIRRITQLRRQGKTYGEIRAETGLPISKSTLSYICRNTALPKEYTARIRKLNIAGLQKGRIIALEVNRIRRKAYLTAIDRHNRKISPCIRKPNVAKIALAMLCLGEASKYNPKKNRSFSLGSSDPRIITLFLHLLRICYPFSLEKVRATVQCRADQNPLLLQEFWEEQTGIPSGLFYKPLIDKRTIGKPTCKPGYHGVLRVNYFDTNVQLDLESLANLVYNQVR